MMRRFLILLLLLPFSVFAEDIEAGNVSQVMNGKSFRLESGDVVRLASLQVPNVEEEDGKKRPGEPMGEEAKAVLSKLILGQSVRLVTGKNPRDRKNRIVAQAYLADGRWVQQEMLRLGMAMVYAIFDDAKKKDITAMMQAETSAREARKGIWANPYFAVVEATKADCCIDQFKLVRGRVMQVDARRGNIYINFGKDYKTDFTAFIPKRYARSFANSDLEQAQGKTVEVRGWIFEQGGPMIELVRPEQLQIIHH